MNTHYKLSQFTLIVLGPDNNFVAKNILKGGVVRLTPHHKELLKSLPSLSPRESTLWERDKNFFIQAGIVCEAEKDENVEFLQWMKGRLESSVFGTYLVTTLGCNLACSYCYERDILNTQRMDEKLYPLVSAWYERKMRAGRFKKAVVALCGGEPLADQKGLRYFVPMLHNLGETLEVPVDFDITSNGVLLTKEVIEFLTQFRFHSIQITLDGPPQVHNNSRPTIGGQPTFWKIVENTELLFLHSCQINLRVNLSQNNAPYLEELFLFLKERGWDKRVILSFGIVEDNLASIRKDIQGICSGCIHSDSEAARVYTDAARTARGLGYSVPEELGLGPCMTSVKDAFVVGPDGSLYKCMEVVGRKELVIGSVISDTPTEEQLRYENPEYLGKCLSEKCAFLPLCAGGCRSESFRATGSFFERYCRYSFLEETNKQLIQIQYGRNRL